jgi:hypothetical protein
MNELPFSLSFVMVKESFAVPAILFYLAETPTKTSIRTTLNFAGAVFEAKVTPAKDLHQQNFAGTCQKIGDPFETP